MESELLPGERLVLKLEELRIAFEKLVGRLDESGVKRTAGLMEWKGRSCGYYWKSLELFLKLDYSEVRNLILEAAELIKECEAENDEEENP